MFIKMVDGFPLDLGGGLARGFPALERAFAPVAGDFIAAQRRANELTVPQVAGLGGGADIEFRCKRAHRVFYHEGQGMNINKFPAIEVIRFPCRGTNADRVPYFFYHEQPLLGSLFSVEWRSQSGLLPGTVNHVPSFCMDVCDYSN